MISHDLGDRAPDVEYRGFNHKSQRCQQTRGSTREERASGRARMCRRRPCSRCHRSFSMLVRVSGLLACCVFSTRLRLIGLTFLFRYWRHAIQATARVHEAHLIQPLPWRSRHVSMGGASREKLDTAIHIRHARGDALSARCIREANAEIPRVGF